MLIIFIVQAIKTVLFGSSKCVFSPPVATKGSQDDILKSLESKIAKADEEQKATGGGSSLAGALSLTTSALAESTALTLYFNLVAGNCLGVGLVYAGTAHPVAKAMIMTQLLMLQGY